MAPPSRKEVQDDEQYTDRAARLSPDVRAMAATVASTGLQAMADRLDAIGGTLKVHSQLGRARKSQGEFPSSRSSQPRRSAQGTRLTCSRVEWQAGSRSRMQSGKWTTPSCRQRSSCSSHSRC